jgi:Tfp pilus assembly protein PilP
MTQVELVKKAKREHVGKWIGLKDGSVVAVSDTYEDVYKELQKKGLDEVYVFYSPAERGKKYRFLF